MLMSIKEFWELFPQVQLQRSNLSLKTYTVGEATVDMRHSLKLVTVEGEGAALLGRDWFKVCCILSMVKLSHY